MYIKDFVLIELLSNEKGAQNVCCTFSLNYYVCNTKYICMYLYVYPSQ